MAWLERISSPNTILKDLATWWSTANTNPDGSRSTDNWDLVFPRPFEVYTQTRVALTATDPSNKIYQAPAGYQKWYAWVVPAVYSFDGTNYTLIDPAQYVVDFNTGKVTFATAQTTAIRATFEYMINEDLPKALAAVKDRVVISTTIKSQVAPGTLFNTDPSQSVTELKVFVEMRRPQFLANPEEAVDKRSTNVPNNHYVEIRMFDMWDDVHQDIYPRDIDALNGSISFFGSHSSDWSKWAWFKDWQEVLKAEVNGSLNVDDITQGVQFQPNVIKGLYGDTPIQVFLSTNSQRVAAVLMGDPTLDYDSYLISFGYLGRIDSFTYKTKDATTGAETTNYYSNDTGGNFALSVASSTMPVMSINGQKAVARDAVMNTINDTTFSESWGQNTANGVTDVSMYRTKSGVYYQKHQVSFITPEEYTSKDAFNPSRYTGKFHLSPAYIIHGYDGYRGFMKDVVVVDNSSIVHLDQLVVNQGQGAAEEYYKYFKLNSPFSVFQNSANWHYGIAIKMV